jgi:hypothetical protein
MGIVLLEDRLLIWKLNRGSEDALSRIYEKYRDDLVRIAVGLLNNVSSAEDVVQKQWNAEIPEGIFDPNIPDDYTELKATDVIPAEAKAGLLGLGIIPMGFVCWRRQRRKRAAVHPN